MNPDDEPPIDTSLEHYLEERALAVAAMKASTAQDKSAVGRLCELRESLMAERIAFGEEATRKRHARGEIYSPARVAAINAYGSTRESLEDEVKINYLRQTSSSEVLKAHARVHFTSAMASKASLLAVMPNDVMESARRMHALEEAFSRAWIAAIADHGFADEIRTRRKEAALLFRTASRPIYLEAEFVHEGLSDEDAQALGKAWNKLDAFAEERGLAALSTFIAFEEEGFAQGTPAQLVLKTVDGLLRSIREEGEKIASKKRVLSALEAAASRLLECQRAGGRAFFILDL